MPLPLSCETMKTLTVSSLSFEYPNSEGNVFDNLSLQLENGELVCLVGPSGCGKTTLLNVIAGFLRPNAGQIEHRNTKATEVSLGYIFQSDALLPWRTIQENIALPAEIRGT